MHKQETMRILGIDPGLGRIGFAVVDWDATQRNDDQEWPSTQWGLITTDKNKADAQRLQELYNDLHALFAQAQPQILAIEKMFFFRNITTAFPVSQARGVILLVAAQYNVPIYEYTPMQVKQTLTGYGKAEKREVQDMIVQLLKLSKRPTPDDAADAVALAYCYTRLHGLVESLMGA